MFIPHVPKHLHISSLEELRSSTGIDLWSVGQGGLFTIQPPKNIGQLVNVEQKTNDYLQFSTTKENWPMSCRDHHILPQEYNNWYICKDLYSAEEIFHFLSGCWLVDPSHEANRRAFADRNRSKF